jgi:hypothetical protein
VSASYGIDPACLLAGWPGRLLHSRTRPLEKRVVEGGKKRKNKEGGENFLVLYLPFPVSTLARELF